jgi:hypothetical protein
MKHKSAKHKGHNVQDNIHNGIKCTRNILYTWDVFRPDQSILAPLLCLNKSKDMFQWVNGCIEKWMKCMDRYPIGIKSVRVDF